jgi:hypothetical protein
MYVKDKIREELRRVYGNFESYLELEYEDTLVENISSTNSNKRDAWVTYNQVILELKHSIKDTLKVRELQYKLTDHSDPNKVCIETINGLTNKSTELDRLLHKIMNFV